MKRSKHAQPIVLLALLTALLMVSCAPATTSTEEPFVVADLFATPGKALATVELSPTMPPSPTPEVTEEGTVVGSPTVPLPTAPSFGQPTQALPTFNPRQPTLPRPTATDTPTPTPTELTPTPTTNLTPTGTISPCTPRSEPFATLYIENAAVRDLLGCAGSQLRQEPARFQPFERGYMLLLSDLAIIYAITTEQLGGDDDTRFDDWFRFPNEYDDTNDPIFDPTPPPDLLEPEEGFGVLWLANEDLRSQMGWATAPAEDYTTGLLPFERGLMLHGPSETPLFALRTNPNVEASGVHLGPLP